MSVFPTVERLIKEADFRRPEAEVLCLLESLSWINDILDGGQSGCFALLRDGTPLVGVILYKALIMSDVAQANPQLAAAVIRGALYLEKDGGKNKHRDKNYDKVFDFRIEKHPTLREILVSKEVEQRIRKSASPSPSCT